MFNKKKYKIILIRKEYQTINAIKSITTNNINPTLKYLEKTYPINIQYPTFCDGTQKVYMIDFEKGSQLKFEEVEALINPSELDTMISNNFIKELMAGALDKKEKMIMAIMGFIMGVLTGVVGMMFYMQEEINTIYESLGISVVIP